MSSAPWSLHLLSEVLAAFTVEKPTALRDVISRVAEAVDAEVAAILGPEQVLLSLGVTEEEQQLLLQSATGRPALLQLAAGQLHTHWAPLHNNELLVVGRIRENYTLEERALLRAMGRSIKLSTQVLEAVQAEKSAKEEALREATHDYLTGLPNRRLVMQRLAEMLRSPPDPEVHRPAVLFIDLDRFKQINDAHGHSTGDQYLLSVSRILRDLVSTRDLVGRLAGDEFIVITSSRESAGVENLAARILGAIDRPLQIGSRHLQYSASIGLAVADPQDSPETLIDNADLAMYRAKELGRGRYACFDRSLRERAQNRADTERELRLALERGEIVAHFQPIISLRLGRVVGFEALARWRHPVRGLLPPGAFLSVAEEAGLIGEIDAVVLRNACRTAALWRDPATGLPPRLSINVSARGLADPSLANRVQRLLVETALNSSHLYLEITETTLVEEVAEAYDNINRLKALGVRLAIDDFGTGYSSLRYLKRFPVGVIKIDRSFVDGLGEDPEDEVIVETVIRMAKFLGIEVVAEGVETLQQASILGGLGCDFLQGYLYGRPEDAERSEQLLHGPLLNLPARAEDQPSPNKLMR